MLPRRRFCSIVFISSNICRRRSTSGRASSSFRSWRAIRQRGIRGGSRKAWHDSEHEPPGQSLRQCKLRKLYENFETGGDLRKPIQRLSYICVPTSKNLSTNTTTGNDCTLPWATVLQKNLNSKRDIRIP